MMKHWRVALVAAFCAGLFCLSQAPRSHAQMGMMGISNGPSAGGSGGGPGVGNVTSGAFGYWGFRAYNTAYATGLGKIANICNPGDAACADVLSTSSGNFNLGTIGGVTCNNSTNICTVKTLYDQSGGNACAGSTVCDMTQATIATRPTLVTGCLGGSLVCMACSGSQHLDNTGGPGPVQAFLVSWVANRTGGTSAFADVLGDNSGTVQAGFSSSANTLMAYAGNVGSYSASPQTNDNAFHAVQELFNSASSSIYADGVSSGSINASTNGMSGGTTISLCTGNNPMTGKIAEVAAWNSDTSANNSSMNSNQHTYWGF